jgi:hypothetical protein
MFSINIMQKILAYSSLHAPAIPIENAAMEQIAAISHQYAIFLKEHSNGGYFYNNALHLLGSNEGDLDFDIFVFNHFVKDIYKSKVDGFFFFAEDLFGQLYAFRDSKVFLFFIDAAEYELVADSFEDWIDIVINDPDYYLGYTFAQTADPQTLKKLSEGYRMGATMPFVLGGAYNMENLRLKHYRENLEFSASIAHQISGVPDGTPIQFKII